MEVHILSLYLLSICVNNCWFMGLHTHWLWEHCATGHISTSYIYIPTPHIYIPKWKWRAFFFYFLFIFINNVLYSFKFIWMESTLAVSFCSMWNSTACFWHVSILIFAMPFKLFHCMHDLFPYILLHTLLTMKIYFISSFQSFIHLSLYV